VREVRVRSDTICAQRDTRSRAKLRVVQHRLCYPVLGNYKLAAMAIAEGHLKTARYSALVEARKLCRACIGLTNPSVCHGGVFDCDEIGAWSRWQGNLDAELMVIGQDWGDVASFVREKGGSTNTSKTNTTLVELLASIGFQIRLPRENSGRSAVFLTNAVLCLKDGGAQARVREEWLSNCGTRFLRPLIDLVQPKMVVCLGKRAYHAAVNAYGISPGTFSRAVESEAPVPLTEGIYAFAVYHCGARILNTHRKLAAQLDDWQRIAKFLARSGTAAPANPQGESCHQQC